MNDVGVLTFHATHVHGTINVLFKFSMDAFPHSFEKDKILLLLEN
jgi:hypothetical protein